MPTTRGGDGSDNIGAGTGNWLPGPGFGDLGFEYTIAGEIMTVRGHDILRAGIDEEVPGARDFMF